MKRFVFSVILVVAALVLLVFAGAGIFLSTLDLGRYRTQLSTVAEQNLGRAVIIEGEIGHSLVPLGLNVERVVVKNTPEFGADDFLTVENVVLQVDLQKLLTGNISVEKISVGKAAANLVVSKAGNKNWEFAVKQAGEELDSAAAEQPLVDEPAQPADKKPLQLDISNVSLDSTAVSYTDLTAGTDMALQLDKIALSDIAMDIDMPVEVAGRATDRKGGMTLDFGLKSVVRVSDSNNILLKVSELNTGLSKSGAAETFNAAVQGEVVYSGQLKSVNISDLAGNAGGIDFKGNFAVILPGGQNLKKGRDIDLRGELHVGHISDKQIEAIQRAFSGADNSSGAGGQKKSSAQGDKKSGEPDFSALKALFIKTDIDIASFSQQDLRLDNIAAAVTMDGGATSVPYTFDFYGGTVAGTVQANLVAKPVSWKIDTSASGVQMEPLLDSLTKKSDVSGLFGGNAALSGTGTDPAVIKRTIQGTADFMLKDSLVKAEFPDALKRVLDVRNGIPVSRADGAFAVNNGLVTIQRLEVVSSLATAQGKGKVNLVDETLEVLLDIQPGGVPPSVPLVIDGSLKNPAFNLHASRMLEDTAREIAKDPVGSVQKIIDVRDELKEGRKQTKENLKELGKELEGVGKGIEGLFKQGK